ncbi:hypothetical protein M2212_000187 [Bradyrhizobium elkanii]|uniref:hypothetical protein n=1 Tax=Bradyrhizobium TaxID=374 RepID=UPI00351597F4|nr:hypothetical protein [Bradyrhizobium elkanii]MCS3473341.1 hypothetical protein [Bradyrhizobium elkanii]
MGACELESGDVALATIPIRKMTIGIAQTLLLIIEWRIAMLKKRTAGDRPEPRPVNVAAAAVDIGSKMHMAAVNPACTDVPVRSFGTFTRDLHELADWFKTCGVTSVAMESTASSPAHRSSRPPDAVYVLVSFDDDFVDANRTRAQQAIRQIEVLIQEATMHGLDAHQLAWIEYVWFLLLVLLGQGAPSSQRTARKNSSRVRAQRANSPRFRGTQTGSHAGAGKVKDIGAGVEEDVG